MYFGSGFGTRSRTPLNLIFVIGHVWKLPHGSLVYYKGTVDVTKDQGSYEDFMKIEYSRAQFRM